MKICINCGCNLPDDHIGNICECCLDDRGDTIPDSRKVSKYERRRRKLLKADDPCLAARCAWNDPDLGCTCPSGEEWYQCPLEPEPDWNAIISESEGR